MKNNRKKIYFQDGIKRLPLLAAAGSIAGFCNGLLGAGGGVVLVLFLSAMTKNDEDATRSVYANSLLVMLPLSLLTLFRYRSSSSLIDLSPPPGELIIGAMLGGILGGVMLGRARQKSSRRLFAVFTVTSGILMLLR